MSQAELFYSCGSCGYPLNLNPSNRIASPIVSRYWKTKKKGVISFPAVDLSRFTQVDEVKCLPIIWGVYYPKTKLLCRKCGTLIGYAYGEPVNLCGNSSAASSSPSHKKYTVKIPALRPVSEAAEP